MSFDYEDKILDACLDEVIGGHYPPDLTAKILQTWHTRQEAEQRQAKTFSPLLGSLAASQLLEPLPPPVQNCLPRETLPSVPDHRRSALQVRNRKSHSHRWLLVLAPSLLIIAMLVVAMGIRQARVKDVIVRQPHPNHGPAVSSATSSVGAQKRSSPSDGIASQQRSANGGIGATEKLPRIDSTGVETLSHDTANTPTLAKQERRIRPRASAAPDTDVIAFVNEVIRHSWRENRVAATEPATEQQWCERVYWKLIGRPPTDAELQQFLADARPNKRTVLVDSLTESAEYAQHWSTVWSNVLLGHNASAVSDPQETAHRIGLQAYLRQSFAIENSFADVATDLLTATGADVPGAEDYNGAVHFLVAGASQHAIDATARTARVFLGKQLQCAQCHDHPTNAWTQRDFWGLNAFFRQMVIARDPDDRAARLANVDFWGESGAGQDAEIFYELPNGRMKMAYPRFANTDLSHSGLMRDFDRRATLAELVVGSDDFPRAIVNRVWSVMLGHGFTIPVDDMGPHNPASHPELLSYLSDEFAGHDFDFRRLTRWIALSEPFGLSAGPPASPSIDVPELGGKPLFARFYERDTPALEPHRALMVAANGGSREWAQVSGVLGSRAATTNRNPLEISAGPVRERVAQAPPTIDNRWLPRLARSSMSQQQKIEHLFMAALGRRPTDREITAAKLVMADQLNGETAVYDIWRALLNSRESMFE